MKISLIVKDGTTQAEQLLYNILCDSGGAFQSLNYAGNKHEDFKFFRKTGTNCNVHTDERIMSWYYFRFLLFCYFGTDWT